MNYCGGWLQPPSAVVLEGYGYVAVVSFGTTGGCPRTVVEVSMAVHRWCIDHTVLQRSTARTTS
jgi:hypothetical protein